MDWKLRGESVDLSERGMIMGILNVTPDSFSDGGKNAEVEKSVENALAMVEQGADIIDVGGESTRPGAMQVSLEDELMRTIPVIKAIRAVSDVYISIDTSKAMVACQALAAGADIVNDVTGLTGDREMAEVCVESGCGVVVMHMKGNPRNMQNAPKYSSVLDEVKAYFQERYESLTRMGIEAECLCFDPGIGFGKTVEHNKQLIKGLPELVVCDRPLMLGVSRKSLIGSVLDRKEPKERDWGTVALTVMGWKLGASIHRVHEVKKNAEAMRMVEAILNI